MIDQREKQMRERRAQKALARLEAMPGMQSVKTQVEQMIQFAKVSEMRKQQGLKSKPHSNHMLFLGNPGTGKTTAARLIGAAFAAMGLLKTDAEDPPFVEVHHSDVAHPHVGEGEKRMAAKFAEARGGILFIDEAYAFLGKSDHRSDEKIVAVIVQKMEDMRNEIIVIAAGYPADMEGFLDSNPGLRSRFTNRVNFPDYSTADLLKIASFQCDEQQYWMTSEFSERLGQRLEQERHAPSFGNARTVRNVIEQAIKRQCVRVSRLSDPSREDLITLTGEDLLLEVRQPVRGEKEMLLEAMQRMQSRLEEIEIEEMLS